MRSCIVLLVLAASCGGVEPTQTDVVVQCSPACADGSEPAVEFMCAPDRGRTTRVCCGVVTVRCGNDLFDPREFCGVEELASCK